MPKKKYMSLLAILLCCMFSFADVCSAQAAIFINVSQSQYLNAGGKITKVAIANPEIADVTLTSGSELIVVGKKSGSTTLYIWTANGIRQQFDISILAGDPQTSQAIANLIGEPDVRVEKLGDQILLRGTVENQQDKEKAEKIAGMYGSKVVNLLRMTHPDQIRLEAKIIEISTDKAKKLGIEYGNASKIDSSSGIVTMGSTGIFGFGQSFSNTRDSSSSKTGNYADVNANLQALITNGDAKLLSQPSVVTMSGEKANILIGGQIPVPINSSDGQVTVEWHDYGIKLNIEPRVEEADTIISKVAAEVSTLDSSSNAAVKLSNGTSIPALVSRKAEAVIHISSGGTMVIGGLLSSDESRQVSKFPFLGDLPIIGSFFRSTSTSKERKELVIMITPTLVDENTPGKMSDDMKKWVEQTDKAGGGTNKNTAENTLSDKTTAVKKESARSTDSKVTVGKNADKTTPAGTNGNKK